MSSRPVIGMCAAVKACASCTKGERPPTRPRAVSAGQNHSWHLEQSPTLRWRVIGPKRVCTLKGALCWRISLPPHWGQRGGVPSAFCWAAFCNASARTACEGFEQSLFQVAEIFVFRADEFGATFLTGPGKGEHGRMVFKDRVNVQRIQCLHWPLHLSLFKPVGAKKMRCARTQNATCDENVLAFYGGLAEDRAT